MHESTSSDDVPVGLERYPIAGELLLLLLLQLVVMVVMVTREEVVTTLQHDG